MVPARSKIQAFDKERLIKSYIALARSLEINESSARTIIRRMINHLHPGLHGGHKQSLITNDVGEVILNYLRDDPLATL